MMHTSVHRVSAVVRVNFETQRQEQQRAPVMALARTQIPLEPVHSAIPVPSGNICWIHAMDLRLTMLLWDAPSAMIARWGVI